MYNTLLPRRRAPRRFAHAEQHHGPLASFFGLFFFKLRGEKQIDSLVRQKSPGVRDRKHRVCHGVRTTRPHRYFLAFPYFSRDSARHFRRFRTTPDHQIRRARAPRAFGFLVALHLDRVSIVVPERRETRKKRLAIFVFQKLSPRYRDCFHRLVHALRAHGKQQRRVASVAHQHDRPRQRFRVNRGGYFQRALAVRRRRYFRNRPPSVVLRPVRRFGGTPTTPPPSALVVAPLGFAALAGRWNTPASPVASRLVLHGFVRGDELVQRPIEQRGNVTSVASASPSAVRAGRGATAATVVRRGILGFLIGRGSCRGRRECVHRDRARWYGRVARGGVSNHIAQPRGNERDLGKPKQTCFTRRGAMPNAAVSPKVMTLLVVVRDGMVLLGEKKRGFGVGFWNGFGGKVEPGETIDAAAMRELREEAGICAVDMTKRGVLLFVYDDQTQAMETHVYHASSFRGDVRETDEMRPKWWNIKEGMPFQKMWPDDELWYPLFLANKTFTGTVHFTNTTTIVKHEIREAPASAMVYGV
jgi:8-oxo-dGTP pyrophosphatase MutT (NUDIX family)